MVRAILAGQKTQTRRVIKTNASGRAQFKGRNWHLGDPNAVLACPFGQPGDRLWVRETFKELRAEFGGIDGHVVNYRAQYADKTEAWRNGPWKPSIHMPRWACRLLLDVKAVRVERLQDISRADAIAEGTVDIKTPCMDFALLWDSLNAKRGYGWDTNPWVWVIEFERE